MSVGNNMDAVQYQCETITSKNSNHMVRVFEVCYEILCDIRLETDDGTIIFGHKVVLITVSQYFRLMFTSSGFIESNSNHVNIKELDSDILQLLINFIYTGEIMVTDENVQDLLPAANILQLDYVEVACIEFLKKQLNPSNCFGIKHFAEKHNCSELLSSTDTYIKKQFVEVVKCNKFLSLSSEEFIKLISSDNLIVPLEEKVFECVINWVNHELDCRICFLPKLMEHVRLALVSKEYLLEKVVDDPLLKKSLICKEYVFDAIHFNLLKSVHHFTIPQTIRSTPRHSGHKVVVVLSYSTSNYDLKKNDTNWYDPATNLLQIAPRMSKCHEDAGLCVVKDNFVLAVGGVVFSQSTAESSSSRSVELLDMSLKSPCWVPIADLIISRKQLGLGVLDNCIYAVGGFDKTINNYLNSVEVFDANIKQWRMVSSMSSVRSNFGVGVLDNLLYVVGGFNGSSLSSVECYNPRDDKWATVAEISVCRSGADVAVLGDIIYAIGGNNGSVYHKSAEAYRPSAEVWTNIADMHVCRTNAGVVTLDGLLYVIGGQNNYFPHLDSVEIYNPNTNTWSMKSLPACYSKIYSAVVVNQPFNFKTN